MYLELVKILFLVGILVKALDARMRGAAAVALALAGLGVAVVMAGGAVPGLAWIASATSPRALLIGTLLAGAAIPGALFAFGQVRHDPATPPREITTLFAVVAVLSTVQLTFMPW